MIKILLRKFFFLFSILILGGFSVFFTGANAYAEFNFPDVTKNHKNYESIKYLYDLGVVDGYPDGTFKPANEVNRAEMSKMLVEASDKDSYRYYYYSSDSFFESCFSDVALSDWYYDHVCSSFAYGFIHGYPDGNFEPGDSISRIEAVKMVLLSHDIPVDEDSSSNVNWYDGYVPIADEIGLFYNDSEHGNLGENIDRAEVSEMIHKTHIWLEDNLIDVFFGGNEDLVILLRELEGMKHEENIDLHFEDGYKIIGDFRLQCEEEVFDLYEELLIGIDESSFDVSEWKWIKGGRYFTQFIEEEPFLVSILMFVTDSMGVAVNSGCYDIVDDYLEDGVDIDAINYDGKASMHIAVDNQDIEMVEFLIQNGADLDVKTVAQNYDDNSMYSLLRDGKLPLDFALEHENLEILELLLENGADLEIFMMGTGDDYLSHSKEIVDLFDSYGARDFVYVPEYVLNSAYTTNTGLIFEVDESWESSEYEIPMPSFDGELVGYPTSIYFDKYYNSYLQVIDLIYIEPKGSLEEYLENIVAKINEENGIEDQEDYLTEYVSPLGVEFLRWDGRINNYGGYEFLYAFKYEVDGVEHLGILLNEGDGYLYEEVVEKVVDTIVLPL